MSDNVVYEIAQMMQNKNVLEKDMSDAMSLVQNMFRERYFDKLHNAVQTHHVNIQKKPPREVQLMRALKEFRPESEHKDIDRVIDMMLLAGSFQKLQEEFKINPISDKTPQIAQSAESPIHPDGIYDVDSACLARKNPGSDMAGLFMMLAMAMNKA